MPGWTPALFVDDQTHAENRQPYIGSTAEGAIAEGTYSETPDGFAYVEAHIKFGSDMDPGHGEYLMTLPVPCASADAVPLVSGGYVYEVIAGQEQGNCWLTQPVVISGLYVTLMMTGLGEKHHVRHDSPFPMAPRSFLHWTCFYRIAPA